MLHLYPPPFWTFYREIDHSLLRCLVNLLHVHIHMPWEIYTVFNHLNILCRTYSIGMAMCICTFTMTLLKRVLTVGLCCSFLFLELQLAVRVSSSISCQLKIAFSCSEGNCMYRAADIYLKTSYLPNRDKLHVICLTCSLSWKVPSEVPSEVPSACPTLFTVLAGVTLAVTAWFHVVQWAHKWIMHHMPQSIAFVCVTCSLMHAQCDDI